MLSLPSSPLRPDPPVSPAPTDFAAPRRLYRGPSLGGSARGDPRDLPCFGCRLSSIAVLYPRRETARLLPPHCFGERIGHRANQKRLASPFPTVSLEHPEGLLVGWCHGAIGSLLLRPSKLLAPPLSDRPRCPSASGRRDLYTRACPQQG